MDNTPPHGELLSSLFGALAQYKRALARKVSHLTVPVVASLGVMQDATSA